MLKFLPKGLMFKNCRSHWCKQRLLCGSLKARRLADTRTCIPATAADTQEQPFPAAQVPVALLFAVPLEHANILAPCPECGVHRACAVQEYGPQAPPLLAMGTVSWRV